MTPLASVRRRARVFVHEKRIWLIVMGAVTVLCGSVVLTGRNGLFALLQLREDRQRIDADIRDLQSEVNHLTELNTHLDSDLEYIEHVAREELGMVRADEVLYQEPPVAPSP